MELITVKKTLSLFGDVFLMVIPHDNSHNRHQNKGGGIKNVITTFFICSSLFAHSL